ncbi:MAG: hypothetical protein C5B59_13385 [Bacteroidetes bacterium]|nr:MAG: hypothetical protein C5B59_13385 [Bacteroidota bacterium]
MEYQLILQNVSKHISLQENERNYFFSILELKEVKRKDLLLREQQICRYIYFVNRGALRAYYVDKSGRESTIMFGLADWWITDMHCFINELPATLYVEALEDSEIVQLNKENFQKLLVDLPVFERFFRIIFQNAYIREQLRMIENLSLTAEERYVNFLKKYPQVQLHVTQKQIASYLGISPEFLSTIRNNLAKTKIS